jgi:fatty-acyl-CoA synthase
MSPPIRSLEDVRSLEQQPYDAVVPWRSVVQVLEASAARWPDRIAMTWLQSADPEDDARPPRHWRYADLLADVRRAANAYRAAGLAEGESVALLLPPIPQAFVALWGAEAAGRACPVNTLLAPEHIAQLVQASRATVLVAAGPRTSPDTWERALAVKARVPGLRALLCIEAEAGVGAGDRDVVGGVDGVQDFERTLAAQPADRWTFALHAQRDAVAALFHTGGTTGLPKLAQHTHGNQVHASWGASLYYGMTPDDAILSGFPIFHVAGSFVYGLSTFLSGARLVLPPTAGLRDPSFMRNWWRWVARERVTLLAGVPTVIAALMAVDPEGADLSAVRAMLTGGSPLPTELAQAFEQRFAIPVRNILGMTECAGVVSIIPFAMPRKPGSCGLPLPYTEVVAVPMQGGVPRLDLRCAPGETGVIALRGPNVGPGYTDASRNPGTFEDGWLVSGDLGHVDADGEVHVTGRAKDVIIRSAHNIDPAVIEEALLQHPAVQLAAAVGEPDAYAGELPVAFVQPKAGADLDLAELARFVAARIPERPALPRRIDTVAAMPLTAIGKIYKPALRRIATERALSAALEPLRAGGWTVSVVSADDGAASTVTVTLPRDGSDAGPHATAGVADGIEAAQQSVRTLLRDFSVRWTLVVGPQTSEGPAPMQPALRRDRS